MIAGAGPAGLTMALELVRRTDFRPLVFEASDDVGGIARTFEYRGNRIDIGGHRFFSRSDRVMQWWLDLLPLQGPGDGTGAVELVYQGRRRAIEPDPDGPDPAVTDDVMLLRRRTSRILFRGKLFPYPLDLSPRTVGLLGPGATARAGASYLRSALSPVRPERTLEDFFINRFGRELYATFFRDYTEKVWGVHCRDIPAEWGAQRVKGLSLAEVLRHAWRSLRGAVGAAPTETSLIESFLYPKFGPGQMWDKAARLMTRAGGELALDSRVVRLRHADGRVVAADVRGPDGTVREVAGDLFVSTMPVSDLVAALDPPPPAAVREIAAALPYRDFVTVGLLLRRLRLGGDIGGRDLASRMPDNWIYVQEPEVKVGRLQFFNNWSPWMVADPDTVWVGLEYFCNDGDAIWRMPDADLVPFAAAELERIGVIRASDVLDGVVIRVPKTYPAYFGAYERFGEVRRWLDRLDNLWLIGRNGMHRYNNQDHSMLAAMVAVDGIAEGRPDRAAVWAVNTEQAYHEDRR